MINEIHCKALLYRTLTKAAFCFHGHFKVLVKKERLFLTKLNY